MSIPERCKTLEEAKEKWEEIPLGRCENVIGQKRNHITILYRTKVQSKNSYFVGQCDCNEHNYIKVDICKWRKGQIKSCGCLTLDNLTGQRFGRLVAMYLIPERDSNGRTQWMCQCDCGNIKIANAHRLKNGEVKSCGCLAKEVAQQKGKAKLINLINEKFGKLTVIELTDKRATDKSVIWKCKCDCGNICEVSSTNLKSGNTQSCGCLAKEMKSKRKLQMLPKGKQYGKLKILKLLNDRDDNGDTIYQCQCECGVIKNISRRSLVSGNTQSCGCIKSKGELKIIQILKNNNILFEKEKTFDNCRFEDTNALARFDFYVNNKYIIEYDGEQHFEANGGWSTEDNLTKIQEHDKLKNQYCFKYNIPIIRIPYTHFDDLCLEDLLLESSKFILKQEE